MKAAKKIEVRVPAAIQTYNEAMGGIDSHDEFISNYRIKIRSKNI